MSAQVLPPSATIGILGGGQLARMLSAAAADLGFSTAILDPDDQCPARKLCHHFIHSAYDAAGGLNQLATLSDVITYEFENVSGQATNALSQKGAMIFPPSQALLIAQDRLREKNFLAGIGLPTTPFYEINSAQDIHHAMKDLGGAAILKTRQFGYDGKGQFRLNDWQDSNQAWEAIGPSPCILEAMVDFSFELSVIAARDQQGKIATYQPAQNIHLDGILRRSIVPCPAPSNLIQDARTMAHTLVEALTYVGVLGLELFALQKKTKEGSALLVNEFAPRVHNSGHWTSATCTHSQFENHIRAIVGWPIADTQRHANCIMENIIGDEINQWPKWIADDNAQLTLYGKKIIRPGRKMGHVTYVSPLDDQAEIKK